MKVLRIFETNNFPFGVILIRTSLLSQKSIGLEEHIVARLLRLGRCCKEMIGKPSRSAWMAPGGRVFAQHSETDGKLGRHPGEILPVRDIRGHVAAREESGRGGVSKKASGGIRGRASGT